VTKDPRNFKAVCFKSPIRDALVGLFSFIRNERAFLRRIPGVPNKKAGTRVIGGRQNTMPFIIAYAWIVLIATSIVGLIAGLVRVLQPRPQRPAPPANSKPEHPLPEPDAGDIIERFCEQQRRRLRNN